MVEYALPPAPALRGYDVIRATEQPVREIHDDRERLSVVRLLVCIEQPSHNLVEGVVGCPCSTVLLLEGDDLLDVVRADKAAPPIGLVLRRHVFRAVGVLARRELIYEVRQGRCDGFVAGRRRCKRKRREKVASEVTSNERAVPDPAAVRHGRASVTAGDESELAEQPLWIEVLEVFGVQGLSAAVEIIGRIMKQAYAPEGDRNGGKLWSRCTRGEPTRRYHNRELYVRCRTGAVPNLKPILADLHPARHRGSDADGDTCGIVEALVRKDACHSSALAICTNVSQRERASLLIKAPLDRTARDDWCKWPSERLDLIVLQGAVEIVEALAQWTRACGDVIK